jgi:hypothetical protein
MDAIIFFSFENSPDQNSFNYSLIIKTMILSLLKVQFFITINMCYIIITKVLSCVEMINLCEF